MSETDDNLSPEESRKLLPAEYVLGVLGASERREFAARLAREPDLAREVAFWEDRLGGLAKDIKPLAPSAATWSRIELSIAQPPTAAPIPVQVSVQATRPQRPSLWQSVSFWRRIGLGSSAIAAASIAALGYVELAARKPVARAPFVATLGQSSGQPGFVAAIGSDGQSMIIMPASLLAADQMSFELWLIPSGGMPHSLGLISAGQPVRLTLPPALVPQVNTETTLAVTREPLGGSPTGQPTSTPIALGKLTNL
jgi:anti-sigma-K factor RskA